MKRSQKGGMKNRTDAAAATAAAAGLLLLLLPDLTGLT